MMTKSIFLAGVLALAAAGAASATEVQKPFQVAVGGYTTGVNCVKGFKKVGFHSDILGWDTLICETDIIVCPATARPRVSIAPEIMNLGIGDKATRYRFKYTCVAYTPQG